MEERIVIDDLSKEEAEQVKEILKGRGYEVVVAPDPDGEHTVIGVLRKCCGGACR